MNYKGANHSRLVNEIMLAIGSRPGITVWKNATGYARSMDGERIISYGLKGSADILGICQGGRFVSIEVKTGSSKLKKEQLAFKRMVESYGGIYLEARSVDDVVKKLSEITC